MNTRPAALWRGAQRSGATRAFTLLELLVVIGIIGIIASISLPALKGLGKSVSTKGATRQLLDDIALARQLALRNRATVYMVFVPTNIWDFVDRVKAQKGPPRKSKPKLIALTNMVEKQYSGYAILSMRSVGDQPGVLSRRPSYVTEWKQLPNGMVIAPHKFHHWRTGREEYAMGDEYKDGFLRDHHFSHPPMAENIPFPLSDSMKARIPYIAFNSRGQLVQREGHGKMQVVRRDEIIPVGQGSIFFQRNSHGNLTRGRPDIVMTPPGNYTNNVIRVNWLTGRASLERPKLP